MKVREKSFIVRVIVMVTVGAENTMDDKARPELHIELFEVHEYPSYLEK